MARLADHDDPIPERLARFVVSEWPGEDPAGQWGAAAREWLDAHPDEVENDGIRLNGAWGPVEVLAETVRLRHCLRVGAPLDTDIRDAISGRWRAGRPRRPTRW
jgi:hypothetical protein